MNDEMLLLNLFLSLMRNYYGTMLVMQFPLLAVFPNRCLYLLEQIGVFWDFFLKRNQNFIHDQIQKSYFTKPPFT